MSQTGESLGPEADAVDGRLPLFDPWTDRVPGHSGRHVLIG